MNLDRNEDYFLHDFNNSDNAGKAPDTTPVPGQTVDFTSSSPARSEPAAGNSELRKRGGCWKFWVWFFAIIIVALAVTVSIRYFIPYTTDSQVRGYVVSVEKRGIVCKTFEGEMVSHAALEDSTRIYAREINFSIPSDSLARVLQSYQGTGRPVTVTLERYYGTLPWRGAYPTVAVAVEPGI
ncbi:MAG: hypothetical protein K2K47_00775 [Duncaniella sp.]|nr:hypothetical protein [Duncaniella sp.]